MKDNKSYNYTDNFSDIIHTARFINAAELSGLFFSAPKWITILMKFRNIVVRSLGLKKERNLSDLVYIESENIATVCKNDKHLSGRESVLTHTEFFSCRFHISMFIVRLPTNQPTLSQNHVRQPMSGLRYHNTTLFQLYNSTGLFHQHPALSSGDRCY